MVLDGGLRHRGAEVACITHVLGILNTPAAELAACGARQNLRPWHAGAEAVLPRHRVLAGELADDRGRSTSDDAYLDFWKGAQTATISDLRQQARTSSAPVVFRMIPPFLAISGAQPDPVSD
jgi:hypothetical protein